MHLATATSGCYIMVLLAAKVTLRRWNCDQIVSTVVVLRGSLLESNLANLCHPAHLSYYSKDAAFSAGTAPIGADRFGPCRSDCTLWGRRVILGTLAVYSVFLSNPTKLF